MLIIRHFLLKVNRRYFIYVTLSLNNHVVCKGQVTNKVSVFTLAQLHPSYF